METKEFPIEVVASLTSGKLLCKFGDLHEAAEFVAGHPIWTHEFADKPFWERLRTTVFAQCPELEKLTVKEMAPEDVPVFVQDLRTAFGPTVTLFSLSDERTESPLDSLQRIAPGNPVITVTPQQ
jgi:hypothetical protein